MFVCQSSRTLGEDVIERAYSYPNFPGNEDDRCRKPSDPNHCSTIRLSFSNGLSKLL